MDFANLFLNETISLRTEKFVQPKRFCEDKTTFLIEKNISFHSRNQNLKMNLIKSFT